MKKFLSFCARPDVFLGILCILTYSPTLLSAFKLDDFIFIDRTLHPQYSSIFDVLFRSENQHFNPLNILLNDALFKVFGKNVVPFHVFNLVLFYLNCRFLHHMCYAMTKNLNIALWTAVLFCIHPLNAEIVNQIVFSTVLFAAVFFQLSLIYYDRYLLTSRKRNLAVALACAVVSFLTLETSWILPLYLFLWAWLVRRINFKQAIVKVVPFIVMASVFFIAWYSLSQGNSLSDGFFKKITYFDLTPVTFTGSLLALLFWYWQKLLIPINGIWIYAIQPLNLLQSVICVLALLLLISLFYIQRKKFFSTSSHCFAGIWFLSGFIFLPPGSLIHPEMGLIIEPYWFYLGSMGFFILIGMYLIDIRDKVWQRSFYVLLFILCTYLFINTQKINVVAKTEKSYSEYWLSISANPVPLTAVAKIALKEKNYSQAFAYYERYLREFSYSPYAVFKPAHVYCTLASIYLDMNQFKNAKALLNRSLQIDKHQSLAYSIMGRINALEEDYDGAQKNYLKAITHNADDLLSMINLADLYIIIKQEVKAIPFLEQLTLKDLRGVDLISVYAKLAVLQYLYQSPAISEKTIKDLFNKDNSVNSFVILAQLFQAFQLPDQSRHVLEQGLVKYPRNKDFCLLAGVMIANQGDLNRAVMIWKKGMQHFPNEHEFKRNIDQAKQMLNQK
ncbi:MAG: hypothetical protein H6754_05505 [Candidatus Omnitrophica bacterium]|nr:hypothetical protein [Candidatus Omnitrophota bacterium]